MLIRPPETVTVELGPLYTATSTIMSAAPTVDLRAEVLAATRAIAAGVSIAVRHDHQQTITIPAEVLWWIVQGADEIGHEHALSPLSPLFDAVEYLTDTIADQAPRTDYGLTAVVDAEMSCAIYEHLITEEGDHRG